MRYIKASLLSLLMAVLVAPAPAFAEGADAVAEAFMKNHDNALATFAALQEAGDLNDDSALKAIQDDISPMINYGKLSSSTVGKFWRKASDEEKAQITEALKNVLELNFSRVLSKFSGQKVALLEAKERPGDKASVLTEVQGDPPAQIEYIFDSVGPDAKVTDVKVEGVSLLANYRRQFRKTLKKDGIPGLIAQLNKIVQK